MFAGLREISLQTPASLAALARDVHAVERKMRASKLVFPNQIYYKIRYFKILWFYLFEDENLGSLHYLLSPTGYIELFQNNVINRTEVLDFLLLFSHLPVTGDMKLKCILIGTGDLSRCLCPQPDVRLHLSQTVLVS